MSARADRRREQTADSGARRVALRWRDRGSAWLRHHAHSLSDSLLRLLSHPLPTLLIWLLIGIALALPAILYVGLDNVQRLSRSWEQPVRISLYMSGDRRGAQLERQLAARADIHQARWISQAQALREFKELSGFADVLDSLEGNPLPTVVTVEPAATHMTPERVATLHAELSQLPGVERVELDFQWLERLHQMLLVGKQIVTLLAALLIASVLLVIGNTIRLAIGSRREEIVIVHLVGATPAFARRPFLYTGFWHGAGGGLAALALIAASVHWASGPITVLGGLYHSEVTVTGLGWNGSLLLLTASAALGVAASWITVMRYLRHMLRGGLEL